MWMLLVTMCVQTGPTEAECLRASAGVHSDVSTCRARAPDQMDAVQSLADDAGVNVLFLSAYCIEGRDT